MRIATPSPAGSNKRRRRGVEGASEACGGGSFCAVMARQAILKNSFVKENLCLWGLFHNPSTPLVGQSHSGVKDCVVSNAGEGQPLTNQGAQGYSPQSIWTTPTGRRPVLTRMAPARAASIPGIQCRVRSEAQPRSDKDKADETYLPAFQPRSEASSWFPRSQSDCGWPQHPSRASLQGSQQAFCLISADCSCLGEHA